MRKLILFTTLLTITLAAQAKGPKKAIFAFYNVENLFDTIDDKHINDNEYLPSADKKWDSKKYNIKLNNLSKVISSISPNDLPWLVGLCEVENKTVVQDLINTDLLRKGKYEIVHRNSPDGRGIDVAAIYRKDKFKLLEYHYYPISYNQDSTIAETREILHVKGVIYGKDTVHVFYNHWPSRMGGEEKSAPKRKAAAQKLKSKVDSLYNVDAYAKIIIMGDFNDHPTDENVEKVLGAHKENAPVERKYLFNLLYEEHEAKTGSYCYKNVWGVLDNLIVSPAMINPKKGARTKNENAKILKEDWMLYTDKKGNQSPSRSYSGPNFHETGYSDHLPIYLIITNK